MRLNARKNLENPFLYGAILIVTQGCVRDWERPEVSGSDSAGEAGTSPDGGDAGAPSGGGGSAGASIGGSGATGGSRGGSDSQGGKGGRTTGGGGGRAGAESAGTAGMSGASPHGGGASGAPLGGNGGSAGASAGAPAGSGGMPPGGDGGSAAAIGGSGAGSGGSAGMAGSAGSPCEWPRPGPVTTAAFPKGGTVFVSRAGVNDLEHGSEEAPYRTINYALAHLAGAKTVLVKPGAYAECVVINPAQNGVTIAADPLGAATIDGDGCLHTVRIRTGINSATVIRGFVIENGVADESTDTEGGGILIESTSSPIIEANVIRGNYAYFGGGGIMIERSSNAVIRGNVIESNSSAFDGAGIKIEDASPRIEGNLIRGNIAEALWGGGIHCGRGCGAWILQNVIAGNEVGYWGNGYGGGIAIHESSPVIVSNLIVNNVATYHDKFEYPFGFGGGISSSVSALHSDPQIFNNTLVGNAADVGGGIAIETVGTFYDSVADIQRNIIVGSKRGKSGDGGEAVFWVEDAHAKPIIDLNAFWSNAGGNLVGSPQYANVGPANSEVDPAFVCGPLDAYYLSALAAGQTVNSECIDTGGATVLDVSLNGRTTRTDGVFDIDAVDLGYHR
jgi:parallel beta-helix repeat protein